MMTFCFGVSIVNLSPWGISIRMTSLIWDTCISIYHNMTIDQHRARNFFQEIPLLLVPWICIAGIHVIFFEFVVISCAFISGTFHSWPVTAQSTYIRLPQCLSPRWNWDPPPPPLIQESVYPPPHWFRGWGAHSLPGEGVEETQFGRGDEQTLWFFKYMRTLWFFPFFIVFVSSENF